ncbi:MAG TPA: protein phosphatase 2C domain-containing protein [Symbiobacteriaceae bacterium]
MRLEFGHRSDPGLVRPTNQDAFSVDLLDPRGNAALLLVADGMGGYEGGEIASRLAVDTVRAKVIASAADWAEKSMLLEGMVQAMDAANRAILQAQRERLDLASMGTTFTAALIWGDKILIGHVGDSKAVLVSPARTTTVTTDHNVAGELVQSGHITEAQAAVHPQRHVLTRALGTGDAVVVERVEIVWQPGDVLLLYTDGLSGLVAVPEVGEACAGEFAALADRLVDMALARGGFDNITVLAARWEG